MATRIPIRKQKQILVLLAKKVTHRKIAKQVGVSRGYVSVVKNRGYVQPPHIPPDKKKRKSQGIGICPTCHHKVKLPCLACSVRRRSPYGNPHESADCALDLSPEEDARRLGVLFWRQLRRSWPK